MRGLTIWQPWASLVATGAKTIETRSRATSYRGPVAIHAAARPVRPHELNPPTVAALDAAGIDVLSAPLRAILAVCELVDCVPVAEALRGRENEAPFGDFSAGRFGWLLDNVRPLSPDRRIIVKGQLGLWSPSPALVDSIESIPHEGALT